jgi:hypothetical protein
VRGTVPYATLTARTTRHSRITALDYTNAAHVMQQMQNVSAVPPGGQVVIPRTVPWTNLDATSREQASALGFTEATWPRFKLLQRDRTAHDAGGPWWEDLVPDQCDAVHALGFSIREWDGLHFDALRTDEGEDLCDLCDGSGVCLDGNANDCEFRCRLQACPNVLVCGNKDPQWLMNINGRCHTCDCDYGQNFDVIPEGSAEECSICMVQPAQVRLPQCVHRFCGPCVARLYGHGSSVGEAPHMVQMTRDARMVGAHDGGCPHCRASTLAPMWACTRAANCRCCRNCEHASVTPHCQMTCACSCKKCRR